MVRAPVPHASPLNPSVTWSTIERIADLTTLPVLVKGLLRARDAPCRDRSRCARVWSCRITASRQLDGVVPTAMVLKEIAAAVAPVPVLVDGGIRERP